VEDNKTKTRKEILDFAQKRFLNVGVDVILHAVELALRLSLTINVCSENIILQANGTAIKWPDDCTPIRLVDDSLARVSENNSQRNDVPVKISLHLTAARLANIYRIRIIWTDNLVDHLDFAPKSRTLTVYQHKILLVNHLRTADNSIIPSEVLEETIDTFNLLFPFGDDNTRQFLLREKKQFYGLGNCGRDRQLDLTKYILWRGRLCDVIEAFNEPPHQWRQLLSDRRNMVDWVTLWVALLVLLLTLVSIAFGTLSTVFAIKQYNLAVAQACITDNAQRLLPNYCH
jgi:hypothetical protein